MNRNQRHKAKRHRAGSGRPKSDFAAVLFADAGARAQAGQFAQAMELYRQVLEIEPEHAQSIHQLGAIAFNIGRFDAALDLIERAVALDETNLAFHKDAVVALRALGRHDEALGRARRVIAMAPRDSTAHRLLGDVFLGQQKWSEAAAAYRQALQLEPKNPEIHNSLAEALAGRGEFPEAAERFQTTVALRPDLMSAWENLATIQITCHDPRALDTIVRGLQTSETLRLKALFTHCLRDAPAITDSVALRAFVVRALSEPWGRPFSTHAHMALIRLDPRIASSMDRALSAWPDHVSLTDLFGADGLAAASADRVLRAVLEDTIVRDIAMERFLTIARAALLEAIVSPAAAESDSADALAFACALARQCFNNEYVFACSGPELTHLTTLRNELIARVQSAGSMRPLQLAILAAYEPLHTLPGSEALLDREWPHPLPDVLSQQVREPAEQIRLRGGIPQLTPIGNDVSARVRDQYEENPYPRWSKCECAGETPSIDARIRKDFPLAPFRPLGRAEVDVLIAGCGTGQHVIGSAPLYTRGRILAVDLSLASLSYAKMRTDALGLANVEYAQADILALGSLDRRFDVIECSGVLHHLADPLEGWRILLSLLRPNGIMRIGLYSELARTAIVAARAFIADRGYGSSPEDIRRCRQDIIALDEASPVRPVIQAGDFYSTSSCRDLLFHVQEHRFTLPAIKKFLAEQRLQFLGFDTDIGVRAHYNLDHPDDPAAIDLDGWHEFELRNQHIFSGMYQFFVQRQD
jgi:tetratricopeptide (TPR) repeat protein/SAM-dependent methyltransferase